ncbi:RecQ family ATP-dependent DNA helicase [Breznakiella homolactica]|uniref:DNA 3'-5' helicase n=1 Tax=Breznakiella homolactica TaxID=2798577 RepID=A0A7T7XQU1_9SPIR|nr:RecQ family ATP-dependent DNA helicase [Breznakiella homolactica]QQO10793.1 RecQ family ATP-dependent DNA helicase [Breznakiella homolactica]
MGKSEPGDTAELSDPLRGAAADLFGMKYLFPYQRLVITNILGAAAASGIPVNWPENRNNQISPGGQENSREDSDEGGDRQNLGRQIVILPTGAGKSLCFQLPAMLLGGPTLVIYPILSLMADQQRRLEERGFSPVTLRGGQSAEERDQIREKVVSGKSRFIIANPEVLLVPKVLAMLESWGIVHIVIDEAHCVSEWGESFRPSYLEIGKIIDAAKTNLITAFTATASDPVLEKINSYIFGGNGAHRIIGNPNRINIHYAARGAVLRDMAVRDSILAHPRPAIVFCSSRPGTERLARYLREQLRDREIRFYHAGLDREEKAAVEQWFFANKNAILVSTCAYGMGVDKPDIRTVIHRDCPPTVEAYLQESGRAGRDGLPSEAILIWGPDDRAAAERIGKEADRRRFEALLTYARNIGACRREQLLSLLNYTGAGESPEDSCCDVCGKTASPELREIKSILGFFRRNRRWYTVKEAAEVLAGMDTVQWEKEEIRTALGYCLRSGLLKQGKGPFWKGKISPAERVNPSGHLQY